MSRAFINNLPRRHPHIFHPYHSHSVELSLWSCHHGTSTYDVSIHVSSSENEEQAGDRYSDIELEGNDLEEGDLESDENE